MNPHPFPYRIIRSNRKTLAIQISTSGQVTVRAPRTMPESTIDNFLVQKESWILKHLAHSTPALANAPDENHPLSDFRRSYYMESARKNIQKKNRILRQKNERNLRPYHDPGAEDPLGKLYQRRQLKLQLAPHFCPGKCS